MSLSVGIDIGSTTVKTVVMDGAEILYKRYERHFSQVRQKAAQMLREAAPVIGGRQFTCAISGSAGLGVAKAAGLDFIQEVFATSEAIRNSGENIDIAIELGGEDAKIIFFTGGLEERMNGTCAGGTGAFIDQMATLMDVTPDELDQLSLQAEKLYPIASRCGVFAKSDIQPLLNQAASKADIAASIFQAVVDQTIAGLAQGRQLEGRIAFLGGPLHFFQGLRKRFVETLKLTPENAVFSELGQYTVAMGAAMYSAKNGQPVQYEQLLSTIESTAGAISDSHFLEPLFTSEDEYKEFKERHGKASVESISIDDYSGDAYLGIDCGSTTVKAVLISADNQILYKYYGSNKGDPVGLLREQLIQIRKLCGDRIVIKGSAATGYGEELVKNAFDLDAGLVETLAHFKGTKFFRPDVDFILDIGGQDIKCLKIKNNAVDSIILNEACSSGCGSFIETFAKSMGYNAAQFAELALMAQRPVDLGSRCTVFMNSSVKQSQKDGASVGDIAAGLAISVVKNAIYKVIRAHDPDELGQHIVVQGGTFHSDAVLRSFEREIGREVVRPSIAGLMGAFGAALYAKGLKLSASSTMDLAALEGFSNTARPAHCGLCGNNCALTINDFGNGKKFISGNKCERPLRRKDEAELPNIYEYKRNRIAALEPVPGPRGRIGLPMGLNMFENIPFWHAFFTELGFEVVLSGPSDLNLFRSGMRSIPSDTVCYPAKLMHGHIVDLLKKGVDTIFYPCMSYNFDEGKGDNHYNCPVVAYYPELLKANMPEIEKARFLFPYLSLDNEKRFTKKAVEYFGEEFQIPAEQVKQAVGKAYLAYQTWQDELKAEGARALEFAQKEGRQVIVLAGRPYHIDAEINHGIDRLISSFGIVVVSEDCVSDLVEPQKVQVLNQWTYHARLYNAAKYCTLHDNAELVQLVSFGCGIDAITTDEVREILESGGKLYTQLKIDEINNLGAVKIRIRSLLGAIEERKNNDI